MMISGYYFVTLKPRSKGFFLLIGQASTESLFFLTSGFRRLAFRKFSRRTE
ncbi:hypothetical protein LINPERHAP1_LOCUS19604 [Linum perenne]